MSQPPSNAPINEPNVFAFRLKQARLRIGLSQEKLGIQAGIDEFSASARINQYERGKHLPDFQMVERLAHVLKVPTPFFFAREDALADWILAFKQKTPNSSENAQS